MRYIKKPYLSLLVLHLQRKLVQFSVEIFQSGGFNNYAPRAGIRTYFPHKLLYNVKIPISKTNLADSIQQILTIYLPLLSGLASVEYRYGNHQSV